MFSFTNNLLWFAALAALLVLFTVLGFLAMKPGASRKLIDGFWLSMLLFLAVLAAWLYARVSPLLAVAPLIPMFIFGKLFWETRKLSK